MRLRFAFLVCLLLCGSAFYSAVSGLLFIPLVPAIERVASQAASCDVSIGRVRVLGKAGVAFDTVVVGPTKAPWLRISTVRVRPKWGDLINRKIALARVTLVEPIAAWDGTPLPLPSAEPGADRFAALALINQLTIVRGRWSSPLTPAITAIDLQSSFLNHTVTMDHLSFETEKGVLRGSGQIALNSGEFNFRSDLQEFRLDRWLAKSVTLPAELTFAFTGKAQVQGTLPQWALQTEGVLIQGYAGDGTPSPLTINVHFDGPKGKIQTEVKGPLLNGSAHMQVNIDRRWVEGRFSLAVSSITRLAPFWPELEKTAGTVAVQGSVKGLWSSPDFSVLGIGKNLRYNAMAAEFLRADIERQGALPRPLALDLAVSSMAWSSAGEDKQVISNAHITWTGDMSEGVLGTNIRSNLISMEAHGPARRKGNGFHWQWDRLKILPVQSPEWRAVPGGELIVRGTESVEIKHLQFGDSNSFFNVRSLAWKNGSLTIDAIAADFPLHFPPAFSGNVSGHLQWMGPLENPGGDFNVSLSSAAIRQSPPLDASVRGTVGESMVTFTEVSFGSAGFPPLHGQGSIPWAWIIQKESGHAMDFSLQAGPLDPAVLFKSFPSMDVQPGGIFRFGARLQGKKSALKAQGTVEARLPGLKIASWGIDAQDARVHLELLNDHFRIREAAVKLGKGSLRLSGESRWPALQWELHGTQLALKLRRQWDFKTDLHLALGGTWTEPTLSGLVSLKEATYEAARKKKGEPDRDTQSVVLPFWERLLLNVQTEWENNVWYRDGLTKIETQGHLLVTKQRGRRAIALSGPLTLLRGSYDAYGRDFILKSGELTFTSSEEIDPLLNVRAEHKMPQTLVELDISGTGLKPLLHFRSTPSMPEPDILALLAIGKVPGQSSPGTTETAPSAALDLAADVVSDYLTRGVRSSGMNVLDLDVIRVAPAEKGKEWTVGRYWGSKLFLSYSYNPEDSASQILKAEYTFLPRWTLVGQTGSTSDDYLDIIFRLPIRDRKKTKKDPANSGEALTPRP